MEENLDHISPILPIDCFTAQIELHEVEKGALKKKHLLPDFSDLLSEDHFAGVHMGWEQKGLKLEVHVEQLFAEEDSIEIFIDTRDLKTAGFITRFCHHFMIYPKPMDGLSAQEITTFRTDDRHELCDPNSIEVKSDFQKRSYSVQIFIPTESLHGYDPSSFDRLGFTYRINRTGGNPQHFALSSDYFNIEKEPSLWSSCLMRNLS